MPGIDKDKLDKYASVIYERLEEFNDFTLKTIARRIKEIGSLSAYDAQTLKNMADVTGDMKKITKKLAEITEMNIADVEKVYTQTVTDGVNTYKPLYDFRNIPFVPFEENEFAKALVSNWAEQTAGEMINLSRTKAIGFDKYDAFGNVIGHTPLKGAYEQAISSAVTAVSSGTADFNLAMKKTIEELGGSGVKVTYGSGVNRSLSAMIRQNLLYGAKQSAQAYDEHIGKLLGCDGFEVDAHAGCRPSHLFMQGKMYSYNGWVTVDGITYEDGKEALSALGDYGCLHFKDDVILGVSQPRYSKKELDEIYRQSTELIEYDGRKKTLYEWKQTQRRFERAVRTKQTQADMFRESGNMAEANMRKKEIATYRAKYDDLCDKLDLTKRTERMRTYKSKSLTNGKNGGIINERSKKNITVITDKAIESVPRVKVTGYTDAQNDFIQQQHKELLKYSRDNNDNKEVAFVFEKGLVNRTECIGSDDSLEFGTALFGKGRDLFVMHNHPRNSGFSDRDIMVFLNNDEIKTITVVKNSGAIETLTKTDAYNRQNAIIELARQYRKNVKNDNDAEVSKAINGFLNRYMEGLEWKK